VVAEREETITAVPLWLLREYLVDAGGTADGDRTVAGDGWTATLDQVDDHAVGSLRVGRVRLELRGDAAAVEKAWSALAPRLIRAGG